jgi:hypothetical protein
MSYFPLLKAPGCHGWTTLFDFAPNDWEERQRIARFANVTWSDGAQWQTRPLGRLEYGEARTVTSADLAGTAPSDALALLSLTAAPASGQSGLLPTTGMPRSSYPQWRGTLGLDSGRARTCYQGELDPFPAPGSLLTFGPFLQTGAGLENYLLFMNVETAAASRTARLEIHDAAAPGSPRATCEVRNNSINVVPLDGLDIGENDLPVIICRQMSGIPLYFSRSTDGAFLSIEHTHPPASSVILGRRWEAQRILKQIWFSRTGKP